MIFNQIRIHLGCWNQDKMAPPPPRRSKKEEISCSRSRDWRSGDTNIGWSIDITAKKNDGILARILS